MKRETLIKLALASVTILTFSLLSPKWLFSICAWIAPAALITFMSKFKPGRGSFFGFLLLFVAGLISNYKVMPFPLPLVVILTMQVALISTIPYLLNRILSQNQFGFISTLIFPIATVVSEYLSSFQGGGTWGSIAYSQSDNLILLQLASVTGVWGVSFLIYWFSSIVVWTAKNEFKWAQIRPGVSIYSSIMLLVYCFGVMRINPYFQEKNNTVRVVGITELNFSPVFEMYHDAFGKTLNVDPASLTQTSPELQELNKALIEFVADPFDIRFANTHRAFTDFQDKLFTKAKREADAGANIIAFSEALFFTVKPIENQLIEKGQSFARDNGVYLVLTLGSFIPGKIEFGKKYIENKAILIDPTGNIQNTFFKNKPVPIVEGSFAGDGKIPTIKTPFGNVSTSICYDADFPSLMRQAGQQETGILVLPSGDWREVSPYHANMARVRAIENGFSILRPVSGATSIACDYYGRVVASRDFFDGGEKTLTVYLPTKNKSTIYSQIGDVLPWMCMAGVVISITLAIRLRIMLRRKSPASVLS